MVSYLIRSIPIPIAYNQHDVVPSLARGKGAIPAAEVYRKSGPYATTSLTIIAITS